MNVYTDASICYTMVACQASAWLLHRGASSRDSGKAKVVDSATAEVISILAGLKQARDLSKVAEVTLVRSVTTVSPLWTLPVEMG